MIFFEKASDRLTKRRDRDLPSMRQMKAEIEKPLSSEFQANRSMFRYFPESRHFALEFTSILTEKSRKWGNQQVSTQSKRGNQQLFMYLRSQKGEISKFLGENFSVKNERRKLKCKICRDSGKYLNMLRLAWNSGLKGFSISGTKRDFEGEPIKWSLVDRSDTFSKKFMFFGPEAP